MRTQIHHLVEGAACSRADAFALTCQDVNVTYAQLWQELAAFGGAVRRLGLCPADRIAVYLDKRIETVAALFGTSVAGGVFVPVNPLLRPRQVGHIIRDCGARILVTSPERLAALHTELEGCKSVEHVILAGREPGLAAAAQGPYTVWPWPRVTGEATTPCPGVIDTDMAAILYTSGSTGQPEGVILSHRNLLAGAESVSHYLGNSRNDVILSALPFSFDAGFSQLTTAFSAGAHVVLLNYLLPADVVRLCARHRVTGLTGVPPLWLQLADQNWSAEATRHLRYFANTGGRAAQVGAGQAAVIVPAGRSLPHVRADRGVPVDFPRSGRGRQAAWLDRQSHSQRRDPRRPSRRFAV